MKTTLAAAYAFLVFLLALLFNGCGFPDPPAYYSIDSEFPEQERETIRDTFAAWCEAADYCPTEALWADRGRVTLVDDLPEDDYTRRVCPAGRDCSTAGKNDGADVILVAKNRPVLTLEALWWVVAHEIGHYCTDHTKGGLMARVAPDERSLEIDNEAVMAWKACDVQRRMSR